MSEYDHTLESRRRSDARAALITVLGIVALLALILFSSGCGARGARVAGPIIGPLTLEQFARGVREDLRAFITRAQKNHPECSADKPTAKQGICPALHTAIDVHNRIGPIVNFYCAGPPAAADDPATPANETQHYNAGGPCSPIVTLKPQVQAILSEALLLLAQNP